MRLDGWYSPGARKPGRIGPDALALVVTLMGVPWREQEPGKPGAGVVTALREALDAGMRVEFV